VTVSEVTPLVESFLTTEYGSSVKAIQGGFDYQAWSNGFTNPLRAGAGIRFFVAEKPFDCSLGFGGRHRVKKKSGDSATRGAAVYEYYALMAAHCLPFDWGKGSKAYILHDGKDRLVGTVGRVVGGEEGKEGTADVAEIKLSDNSTVPCSVRSGVNGGQELRVGGVIQNSQLRREMRLRKSGMFTGVKKGHLISTRRDENNRLMGRYGIGTHDGDSGAPVYAMRGGPAGPVAAVGIHSAGSGGTSGLFTPVETAESALGGLQIVTTNMNICNP
jgi:V8-like Glu-specific endopeptidase